MSQSDNNIGQICPCALTISLLSSKWKILIMRDLLKGTRRYSELKHSVSGISQKMLTQSLKEMANDGLVNRKVYPEVPPRVEYSLTDTGESLRPVINVLNDWGNGYLDKTDPEYLNKRFNLASPKNEWMKITEEES